MKCTRTRQLDLPIPKLATFALGCNGVRSISTLGTGKLDPISLKVRSNHRANADVQTVGNRWDALT